MSTNFQLYISMIVLAINISNIYEFKYYRQVVVIMDLSRYEFIQSLRYCSSLSIELYDNKNRKIVCIPCIKGTISIKNSDKGNQECIGCLMHFKRVNIINLGHYYCKECPRNRLSDLNFPSYSESCDIENNFELNKILVDGELLECSKKIENSLGRDKNTLPYSTHCKCPNDSPRVIIRNSEFTMTCLSADLSKKIIDYKGLDYRLINTVKFSNIIYFYINCDPNRESVDLYETCLCPPGYIFSDYRCKQCTNGNLIDTNKQHYCLECKKSGILSLDGKDCSNYDFNFSETPDNIATHLEERNCFGNFVYTDNSCQLCEGKKVKSLKNNQCICPYSPKPQDKDCNVCVSDDVDSKNCECGGNSRLSANLCICGQNQFVNSNNECFDCEKGFITDHLSPNYCVCPAGKFIDNTGRCNSCPKGMYSTKYFENKCLKCPFLKTTFDFESNSVLLCNKIDIILLIVILIFLLLVLALIILTIYCIWMKKINKNFQNQDRDEKHQYLNDTVLKLPPEKSNSKIN